jgi:hypothetical protein
MKYNFLMLLILLFSKLTYAQRGIDFIPTSYNEALNLAKKQNKLVFVAYSNYGGNSRWMEQNVLNQSQVGAVFNEKFINIKINGESIRDRSVIEGFKYRNSTSGYFFFNAKGELIHKFDFLKTTDEIISEAKIAYKINENFSSLEKMDKLFHRGERSREFLYLYSLRRLQNVELNTVKERNLKDLDSAIREYILSLSEEKMRLEPNMLLACEYLYQTNKNCSDILFQLMIHHIDATKDFSNENLEGFRVRVSRIIDRSFNEAVLTKNEVLIHDVARSINSSWYEKESPLYNRQLVMGSYKIDYYEIVKDWDSYQEELTNYINYFDGLDIQKLTNQNLAEYEKYQDKLKFTDEEWASLRSDIEQTYNEEIAYQMRLYGWRFAQHIEDKEALKAPLKWLNKSIRLSSNPIALKTYSKLLYKIGREDEAKKYAAAASKLPSNSIQLDVALKDTKE